jgi:hypothetical protein
MRDPRAMNPEKLADSAHRVQVDTASKVGNICVKSMNSEAGVSA